MTPQQRFENIKKQIEDKQALKIRIQTQIDSLQTNITEKNELLAESGIEYDTLEELEELLTSKQARVESLLTNMEQQLNG